jgi:hypothetical protein
MKSGRSNFTAKEGPGPGEYTPFQSVQVSENKTVQETASKKFEAHIPRFTEQIVLNEKKQVN